MRPSQRRLEKQHNKPRARLAWGTGDCTNSSHMASLWRSLHGGRARPPDVGMTHRGQWNGFQRHFYLRVLSRLPSSLVSEETGPLSQQAGGAV